MWFYLTQALRYVFYYTAGIAPVLVVVLWHLCGENDVVATAAIGVFVVLACTVWSLERHTEKVETPTAEPANV